MAEDAVEVAVVGAGPTGLTAAIALAAQGVETALIAERPCGPDNRTSALLVGSVAALETLNVWERCRDAAAPLSAIRIIDDTRRLLRAPEVMFAAAEVGLDAFGYNIANSRLFAALDARAAMLAPLASIKEPASSIEVDEARATVTFATGRKLTARLVIGADGRRSLCRSAARIEIDGYEYRQSALTLNLGHGRAHGGISTEFHAEGGPFTLVPLPGKRSSLVCVVDPTEADNLNALDDSSLSQEIERRSHSIVGTIAVETERGIFRLAVETARRFGANRVALVGEAAHVLPPIGAQGLNLGLRDAATIAELVVAARRRRADIGGPALLARYDALRRSDVKRRTVAVDLLNRILLSDFLPIHGARGLGLYVIDRIGPLRRAIMREGVAPAGWAPRLMRGEML
jgi:2-octaprenyl-6-methoxyphenol hydroxylase